MLYLMIGLTPLNCLQTCNLTLYAATMFYWVLTLVPRAWLVDANEKHEPR